MRVGGSTGGEAVARYLAAAGLELMVTIPGSQTLPIGDAAASSGLRVIVPRHERHGAYLAEGYGQARGLPALLVDTLGPGVANELVGLESARQSATPILCVAPFQPPRKRRRIREVFQGLDHPTFFESAVKHQVVVDDAALLERSLERALEASSAPPPGPVRLDVSFPILFQRKLLRAREAPRARLAPGPRPKLLVIEAAGSTPLGDRQGARQIAPGLPVVDAFASFALGAKLAWPDVPTILRADPDVLRAGLGALAVAALSNVPVLLAAGDAERPLAERAAALLGAEATAAPRDADALCRLAAEHASKLLIAV